MMTTKEIELRLEFLMMDVKVIKRRLKKAKASKDKMNQATTESSREHYKKDMEAWLELCEYTLTSPI